MLTWVLTAVCEELCEVLMDKHMQDNPRSCAGVGRGVAKANRVLRKTRRWKLKETKLQDWFSSGCAPPFEKSAHGTPKVWNEVVQALWGKSTIKRHVSVRSGEAPVEIDKFTRFLSIRLLHDGRRVMELWW